MLGAQLIGEITSQVAKARAPAALGFFPCLDGFLLFFFTAGDIGADAVIGFHPFDMFSAGFLEAFQ